MSENAVVNNLPTPGKPGKKGRAFFALAVLIGLLLFPLLQFTIGGMNYWLHMALYIFMYTAMASSWNIIGGYAGYVSLGHNVFFALGAYVSGMLLADLGISPFITAPLAGIGAFLVGLLVGLISLRTR